MRTSFVAFKVVCFMAAAMQAYGFTHPDSTNASPSTQGGLLPLPIIFYTPETGFAGGASVMYFYRNPDNGIDARPSSIISTFIYTQKRQVISEVAYELYFLEDRYRLDGSVEFVKFPDKFYGIGNNTPDALEETFNAQSFRFHINALRSLSSEFKAGVSYYFENRTMLELEPGRLLAGGTILGGTSGVTSGAGVLATFDTRDNVFSPFEGSYYQLSFLSSHPSLGSDYNFNRLTLDLREYLRVQETHVLGVQVLGTSMTGSAPFHKLVQLGGQNLLRGYYEGRYRDKGYVAAQAEYRAPLFGRLGSVVFASAGDVAPTVSQFSVADIKPSYGFGLRYLFNEKERLNIRMDFGVARGVLAIYFGAGEAF